MNKVYRYKSQIKIERDIFENLFIQAITCYGGSDPIKLFRLLYSMTQIIQSPFSNHHVDNMFHFIFKVDYVKNSFTFKYLYYKKNNSFYQFLSDVEINNIPRNIKITKGIPSIKISDNGMEFAILEKKSYFNSVIRSVMNDWVLIYLDALYLVPLFIKETECFIKVDKTNILESIKYLCKCCGINKYDTLHTNEKIGIVQGRNCLFNFVVNKFKNNFVLSLSDDDDVHCPLSIFNENVKKINTKDCESILCEINNKFLCEFIPKESVNFKSILESDFFLKCDMLTDSKSHFKIIIDDITNRNNSLDVLLYPYKVFYKNAVSLDMGPARHEDVRFFINMHWIHLPLMKYSYEKASNTFKQDTTEENSENHIKEKKAIYDSSMFLTTGKPKHIDYIKTKNIANIYNEKYEYICPNMNILS